MAEGFDESTEWQTVSIYAAGKMHEMKFKTIGPVLWRKSGPERLLRLVVIAPLAYRLNRHSGLLYRQPAYLICSEWEIDPAKIVKAYVNRWDIEVNFRDEKGLLGFNEAQVRTKAGAELAPALAVSSYAVLLLAASKVFGANGIPSQLRSEEHTSELQSH